MARPIADIDQRFLAKVKADSSGCLLWLGTFNHGYPVFSVPDRSRKSGWALIYAHHYNYEKNLGPIPDGHWLVWTCKNRQCVNHSHLEALMAREVRLMGNSTSAIQARKIICVRGHPLEGGNLYRAPGTNKRQCRICTIIRADRNKTKRRAKLADLRKWRSHTPQEWRELLTRYKHRCANCGEKTKLTRDHIIPLSKGGHDGIENIQPFCKPCNSKKRDRIWQLC